ncbi:MAG: undecaprenyl-diphosphate phosphatase [Gemmatimonadota bacterium]|nr:undecaprenyl-diphosphate phosphatase [Gemmatimonadota bacterium]MDP7032490.1 undecaprenyl-diphosphate phosphatase [Gemmatimonadota bacterium]
MNSGWEALLTGVLQGLTEFLPVSSSGHLALLEAALGSREGGIGMVVLVHAGTLLAILTVFHEGARRLARGLVLLPMRGLRRRSLGDDEGLAARVLVATVPGAAVGLFLEDRVEAAFASTDAVGVFLMMTGALLFSTRRLEPGQAPVSWKDAIWIGCAQAVAVLPGISRSGATLWAALRRGVARPAAAEFSFLAAVPLILGSLVLKLPDLARASEAGAGGALGIAFVAAFATGLVALIGFLRVIRSGRLHFFAPYCALVGLLAILAPRVF